MTEPTTLRMSNGNFNTESEDTSLTVANVAKMYAISSERPDDEHHWVVAWNGHEFEAVRVAFTVYRYPSQELVEISFDPDSGQDALETDTILHYPIDPRMTCLLYTSPSPRDS